MANIENTLPPEGGQGVFIDRTSQLINDGATGDSRYVELSEIGNFGGDKTYTHDQAIPASIWYYQHGLNKKPSITITDTAGTVIEGQVTINDGINIRIEFNHPFSGYALNN